MKKTVAVAVFAFVGGLAAPALAGEGGWTSDGGLYLSARGLVQNLRGTNQTSIGSDYWDYGIGYGAIGAVGYAFVFPKYGADIRTEIEGSYRQAANDSIIFADGTYWDISGNTTIKAAMVNVLIDFHTQTRFSPYVGAGLGRTEISFDSWSVVETDPLGTVTAFTLPGSDSDVSAWQVMAGFGYGLSPGLNIELEYRYFQPNDPNYNGLISNEVALGLRMVF